jgi:ABC-type nickel/cobalt efflux system permease component RcnA
VTGFVAGLIPCPSALGVVLIAGMTFSGPALYFSIFIYVLGIALTLIGIMLLFLFFKEKAQKQLDSVNKKFNTNLIAAFLIITIGVLYLLMNLLGTGHQH